MSTAPSAYVVGSALLTFPKGFTKQNQDAVINTILLADLASNKRFGTESSQRYAFFLDVAETVGLKKESLNPHQSIPNEGSTAVNELVITTLQQALPDSELSSIKDTIQALESGNNFPAKLFDEQATGTSSGKQAIFGIGSCRMDGSNPSCTFNYFDFTFSGPTTSSQGVLFRAINQSDAVSG
ncbi:hypothetical protein JAAARDRAFT_192275 [Jaapia argillacea MUCL 33604]|uniref:Uncharacterized protein n=1 Tax=Jaapia argillacea MUCL 33604 TaxID=933084 RepID=A0A067QB61_9AGAM|nr:hypothetical protein JAAARDRAFT_192275 [Jaapia argillacea MUCL 33604]